MRFILILFSSGLSLKPFPTSGARDLDFSLALRNSKDILAIWTFEKLVSFSAFYALFKSSKSISYRSPISKKHIVFRSAFYNIP